MPTLNTFARLNKPKQFRPSEPTTFLLEYSGDLCPTAATIKLYNGDYGLGYLPYKQTEWASVSIDGVYWVQFDIPAYALGEDPCEATDYDSYSVSPGLTAVVELGDNSVADGVDREHSTYPIRALQIKAEGIKLSSKYDASSEEWFKKWKAVVTDMNDYYGGFTVPTTVPSHDDVRRVNLQFNELYFNDARHVSNVKFTSNSLLVPIYLNSWKYPLTWGWDASGTTVTSSVLDTYLFCHGTHGQIGSQTDHYINSYRYFLYDENYKIVYDSGSKYDWSLSINLSKRIRITGLKNNKTYYLKARAFLAGGYIIESETETIHVKYDTVLLTADELSLKNIPSKGTVEITTKIKEDFDKLIIERTVKDEGIYLKIGQYDIAANIKVEDSMCLPNAVYTYRVTAYLGDTLVGTYCSEITHTFNGLCLSDNCGVYCAEVNERQYPVQKNTRTSFQTTMGSKYPYAVITSAADYHETGSVSGSFFDSEDECMPTYQEIQKGNGECSHNMLNWLNNGNAKLLKYDNGFVAIVAIDGNPSISRDENTGLFSVDFGWKEIADCRDIDNYVKCGLVGDI